MPLQNKNIKFLIILCLFLLFFIFSITGANTYILYSYLSFRNIFFINIILIIIILRDTKLTREQLIISFPIILLYLLGIIYLFVKKFDVEVLKDFFYFTFIPFQLISILLLGNKYHKKFYRSIFYFSKFLLYSLFITTVFEYITNIHLPSHNTTNNFIPTAFFTNPNDLSIIVVSIFMTLMALGKDISTKKQDILFTLLTGFIIFITLSRIVLIVFIFIIIVKFLSKKYVKRIFILIATISILLLIISQINIPQNSNSIVNRSIIRINSIANIGKQKNTKGSSISIRYDIYSIPFRNSFDFVIGNGFNSDMKVIRKYKKQDYDVINSHSFFIQTIFYFGWFGFFLLLTFFILLLIYGTLNSRFFFIVIIISQMLIINIPSSIIRMPVIWIPFFILISYYTTRKINA